MQLRGTTVLITGASYGIGAALAPAVARRGAACVVLLARRISAVVPRPSTPEGSTPPGRVTTAVEYAAGSCTVSGSRQRGIHLHLPAVTLLLQQPQSIPQASKLSC